MTHLYIIRHGQAISAVENIIANTGLSPLGVKQAEHLRDRLAATGEIKADVLIASTMLRAKETAEIIAPALGLPIIFDAEVEEWRDGETKQVSATEYEKLFQAVEIGQRPFVHLTPMAESWSQFVLRAATALNRITQEHAGKTIVVVAHGGIVDTSFILHFGLSGLRFTPAFFATHNTSITHWMHDTFSDFPPSWILERYNDTMHLRDLKSPIRVPWKDLSSRTPASTDESVAPTETRNA